MRFSRTSLVQEHTRHTLTVGGFHATMSLPGRSHRPGHCLGLGKAARLFSLHRAYSIVQVCAEVNNLLRRQQGFPKVHRRRAFLSAAEKPVLRRSISPWPDDSVVQTVMVDFCGRRWRGRSVLALGDLVNWVLTFAQDCSTL